MREEIIEIISKKTNINPETISSDTDLTEFGLTSITLVNIVVDLEEKFDFEFDDEDLLLTKLNTIEKIEACIREKLGE